jgi:hypothetical protein
MLWRAPNVAGTWDPATNSWSSVTPLHAPSARTGHTLIWTDAAVLVWGGSDPTTQDRLQTGGRYAAGEPDVDGDLDPDACDPCPLDPANDADADSLCANLDNCPDAPNPGQADQDDDDVGDACDPCPGDPVNDGDADGLCGSVDNCPTVSNPFQSDADLDGAGNICDLCPSTADLDQLDSDQDGSGDACDCDELDGLDRPPPAVPVEMQLPDEPHKLSWSAAPGADRYSVLRGDLADLRLGTTPQCFATGLTETYAFVPGLPAAGQGYYFLVQAESFDCGFGSLGFKSGEIPRPDPQVCSTTSLLDIDPVSEQTIYGSTSGGLAGVQSSDDVYQELTEESTSGPPGERISRLEHRWVFDLVPGTAMELHIEGFRTDTAEGDEFQLLRSADGVDWIGVASLPSGLVDPNGDAAFWLPPALDGQVFLMIRDTDRSPGRSHKDRFFVDELFIRVVEP